MFVCERCHYETKFKQNLVHHLQTKKECPCTYSSQTRQEIINKLTEKALVTNNRLCPDCGKVVHKNSLSRHKKICKHSVVIAKVDNINDVHYKEHIEHLQQQINMLSQRIHELETENKDIKAQMMFFKSKKNEDFFQCILEKHFGASHKTLETGITDITTDTTHIEIKRWSCWREAYAQLLLYNSSETKEHLYACFFGEYQRSAKDIAIKCLQAQNITCFEFKNYEDYIDLVNVVTNESIRVFSCI